MTKSQYSRVPRLVDESSLSKGLIASILVVRAPSILILQCFMRMPIKFTDLHVTLVKGVSFVIEVLKVKRGGLTKFVSVGK